MLKLCSRCKGTKKISQLGMMEIKCDICEGIGYIDDKELNMKKEIIEKQIDEMPEGIAEAVAFKEIKRRGRKPRETVIND